MVWRNSEHYPDPTAGAALRHIAREEARREMNEGKRFERDFKASVPADAWCYRLRDSPVSYYGGSGAEGIRFAQDNLCDFVLYRAPTLYLLELKTVGTPSAALSSLFGKFDPEKSCYKKQRHLQEMAKAEQSAAGLRALVVLCYRRTGHTYAVPARDVLEWVERAAAGGRKSIPEEFCINHGTHVAARQLRVNWRYDVAGMMEKLGGGYHSEENYDA